MSSESMLYPQMTFLQMLQAAMQPPPADQYQQEEETAELEAVQQKQERSNQFQHLLPPSNLQLLFQFQQQEENNKTLVAEQIESCVTTTYQGAAVPAKEKERKKRKRARPSSSACTKNEQEMESQRMTHIAVERNRRRLMNSHIHVLRSLMPSSFLQRSDQASIVGGAVDFVKELEQLLHSLQAEKRMRTATAAAAAAAATNSSSSDHSSPSIANNDQECNINNMHHQLEGFFVSPQYTGYSDSRRGSEENEVEVDVEATVVQGHVNLKVAGMRRPGKLVRAIAALEQLGLTVLHLNITSLDSDSILYSLNLKMEEECRVGSADELAAAVHQIFTYINVVCY